MIRSGHDVELVSAPLVSVIVPTRNSSRTLEACLRSIRLQAYPRLELVVIDNSSTDDTLPIAREFADIVQSHGPERSAQRNLGARLAHGDYLLFVDSDMLLPPQVIGECITAIRCNRARAVIVPEISIGLGFWARCRAFERSLYIGDDLVEAARFFPRGQFEGANGFDEALTGPEDWDLSRRIAAGTTLPRTNVHILHDEGKISLASWMGKKRYYGSGFLSYIRKHGKIALWQANIVVRPAYIRNWRRVACHPMLAFGMLALKCLETLAALAGIFLALLHTRRNLRGNSSACDKQ